MICDLGALTMELAEGFVDHTLNSYILRHPAGSEGESGQRTLNLSVARDWDSQGKDPVAYCDGQIVAMAKALPAYELIRRTELELLEQTSVELEFRWYEEQREIRQLQTYVRVPDHFLIVTMSFEPSGVELARDRWSRVLASLRLA